MNVLCFLRPDWKVSRIWDEPGGTMTICAMPDSSGTILAVQNFFPVFKAENAIIVSANASAGGNDLWVTKKVLDLPYVHRFEGAKSW